MHSEIHDLAFKNFSQTTSEGLAQRESLEILQTIKTYFNNHKNANEQAFFNAISEYFLYQDDCHWPDLCPKTFNDFINKPSKENFEPFLYDVWHIHATNTAENLLNKYGCRGLTLPPEHIETFAPFLIFDGIGRITGLKKTLSPTQIDTIKKLAITPLTKINSNNERTAPKTPTESLLYFNYKVKQIQNLELKAYWLNKIKDFWFEANISKEALNLFYDQAIIELKDDEDLLAIIKELKKNLAKEIYPTQLYDNLFGRIFSSEFGRLMVENATNQAKRAAKPIAFKINNLITKYFDSNEDADEEKYFNSISEELEGSYSNRPWFELCSGSFNSFFSNPNKTTFNNLLFNIQNGYDVIKTYALLIPAIKELSAIHPTLQGDLGADNFYITALQKLRTSDIYINSDLKVGDLKSGATENKKNDKITIRRRMHTTNSYDSKLRHQPRTAKPNFYPLEHKIDHASVKILHHDRLSPFEQNMLASGQPIVYGASGTTNLACFFHEYIANTNKFFSKDQAFLNVLSFVTYDGGHSIAESLAVYNAVQKVILDKKTLSETHAISNAAAYLNSELVNFKDLLKLKDTDDVSAKLDKAYNEMIKAYEKYAFSVNQQNS